MSDLRCPNPLCGVDKRFIESKLIGIIKSGNIFITGSSNIEDIKEAPMQLEVKCPMCKKKSIIYTE